MTGTKSITNAADATKLVGLNAQTIENVLEHIGNQAVHGATIAFFTPSQNHVSDHIKSELMKRGFTLSYFNNHFENDILRVEWPAPGENIKDIQIEALQQQLKEMSDKAEQNEILYKSSISKKLNDFSEDMPKIEKNKRHE